MKLLKIVTEKKKTHRDFTSKDLHFQIKLTLHQTTTTNRLLRQVIIINRWKCKLKSPQPNFIKTTQMRSHRNNSQSPLLVQNVVPIGR